MHDIHVDSKSHNPADFEVSMPNSLESHNVVRIVPHTVSIPRMFPNVYDPSNRFTIWRRKTKLIDMGDNYWFVTGQREWTPIEIKIPPGHYSLSELCSTINTLTTTHLFFQVDDLGVLQITGPYTTWDQWGQINQPDTHPDPPLYMPQTFITEPEGSHFFDVLGLGGAQFVSTSANWLSYVFDEQAPSTADAIQGSPIEKARLIVPAFSTSAHEMGPYLYTAFPVGPLNPPNLQGPLWVNVVIEELGDQSTIDTETGKPISVVSCVAVCDVPYGQYATRTIRDCDAEAIQYSVERSFRSFRVRCEDQNGDSLTLPRNWPVLLRLQILQTS